MEQNNKQESLKQWYLKFIDHFRKEYEKLSADEKKGISNTNNFLNPCQIEVFWIVDLDYQLIIQSNFSDRPDKEIIINGPYKSYEFCSKAITILKEKRWMHKFKEILPREYESFDTLGGHMSIEIHNFIELSKLNIFASQSGYHRFFGTAVDDIWAFGHTGNVGELDLIQETNKIIYEIKQNAKFKQDANFQQERKTTMQQLTPTTIKYDGFGVHLFPPIVIGLEHKRSMEEVIRNASSRKLNNKIFDMEICNNQVIVNNDGFIFVKNKDKENVLKILNLIMALGTFYKFHLHAVREQELVMANCHKQDLTVAHMRWNTATKRTYLMDYFFDPRYNYSVVKTGVNPDTIKEILSNTEKLLGDEKLSEDMRLLNDGKTHFANSEFTPAFVMGWSVIERHYFDLWDTLLRQKNIGNNRLKKLNSIQRPIDSILQILRLLDEIDENSYNHLMKLKNKRNEFYHNGTQISKDDANCCLKSARKLLYHKINKYITISNNL